jgi:hypothetical protein
MWDFSCIGFLKLHAPANECFGRKAGCERGNPNLPILAARYNFFAIENMRDGER